MSLKDTEPRMVFGFLILLAMAGLAAIIALGKVHQESSFGLQYLLGGLTAMAGGFTNWAFSGKDKTSEVSPNNGDAPGLARPKAQGEG